MAVAKYLNLSGRILILLEVLSSWLMMQSTKYFLMTSSKRSISLERRTVFPSKVVSRMSVIYLIPYPLCVGGFLQGRSELTPTWAVWMSGGLGFGGVAYYPQRNHPSSRGGGITRRDGGGNLNRGGQRTINSFVPSVSSLPARNKLCLFALPSVSIPTGNIGVT